jgi:exonuclease III
MLQLGKMQQLASEILKKFQVDIVALQEIRWSRQERIDKHLQWIKKAGQLCTGFVIAKAIRQNILQIETISTRICKVRIKGRFRNITIILAHAPTENNGECEKERFCVTHEEISHETPKHDMSIVMGDFSGTVGKETHQKQVARMHTMHENSNGNGRLLGQFATRNNMLVNRTAYLHKRIHLGTWKIPGTKLIRSTMYRCGSIIC